MFVNGYKQDDYGQKGFQFIIYKILSLTGSWTLKTKINPGEF